MQSIKLSKLKPEDYIITGKLGELGTVHMLLYRIYEGIKLPSNPRIIIYDQMYKIDIDIKREDIIQGFKCWVCGKYLGEDSAIDCPDHPDYAPEYIYFSTKMSDNRKYKYYNNVCILTKVKCDKFCSICEKRIEHEKAIKEIDLRRIKYYDKWPSYGCVWGD